MTDLTTTITDTPCTMTVNGHAITGREWLVRPFMPHAGAVATADTDYRTRNTGKEETCYVFLGIPYAHQPVGARRWTPGEKVAPSAAIDASQFGSVAPQGYSQEGLDLDQGRSDLGEDRGLSAWPALGTEEGEDCLNLNIYSPTLTPSAALPVVIHLHGGGSNYLSACDDRMSGHRIALKGVIVVRVEYRLGNLGHYYLPGMEGEGTYVGVNFSMTDAFAAFLWVKDHIADMGGDASNVTIMGGSAGGNMCHVALSHPTERANFQKVWSSSASAGVNTRWRAEPIANTRGYEALFGDRRQTADVCGAYQRSTQDPLKSLAEIKADLVAAGSTVDEAYRETMREHMSLNNFMSFDEGATGRQLYYEGYQATRSLTIMRDEETCFHDSNLDFALSGAVPGTHNCVFFVCEDEASVIGGGGAQYTFAQEIHDLAGVTTQQWSTSAVYDTEWNASSGSPTWGALDTSQIYYPWGTATEPNRMIFNQGYQYPAYCMARAVEDAGAVSYLGWCNWKPLTGGRVGHTADEPLWFNNLPWLYPAGEELITADDIKFVDRCAQLLANFAKHGNPNTAYAYATDFDLFASPATFGLTAFDPANKNWNVMGNGNRSASTSATVTDTNDFWDHAWDYYDVQNGV